MKDAEKKEGESWQTSGAALENLKLCEAEQGTGQQGKREQGLELHTIIGPTLGSSMSPSFKKGFCLADGQKVLFVNFKVL